jgi:hypothetical protein
MKNCNLTVNQQVTVNKPWWIKVEKIQCRILQISNEFFLVRPLTGNSHTRYVRKECVDEYSDE